MKLELGIMAGAETKKFLVSFTEQMDRLEKYLEEVKGLTSKVSALSGDDTDTAEDEDEDEDFGTKKTTKKKAASNFEDEDEDEEEENLDDDAIEDEEEEDEEPAPAKKTKAKKITVDDVNDACRARAQRTGGKKGRAEVLAVLKKKFKTESVTELKPDQYAAVIAAMEA